MLSQQCEIDMPNVYRKYMNYMYYLGQNLVVDSRDCFDLYDAGVTVSGVYTINLHPEGVDPEFVQVYCDMDTAGGPWTVSKTFARCLRIMRYYDILTNF